MIQAAIDWLAASGGGTVLIPNGKFNFTGEITLKPGVDLWGSGGHGQGVGSGGTVLRATADNARLLVHGVGGQTGNFVVDGNRKNPGGEGLVCIGGDFPASDPRTVAVRQFTTFRVAGSATNGLVLLGVQNCSFTPSPSTTSGTP